MIVTDHFVFIHVSRTGGTFLNRLILAQIPGARMLRYHGHLRDLPAEYGHLPVIGFVRNPWDWYVSMHNDYRRKRQFVFQILSDGGALGFERTAARFLNLGDGSALSRGLLLRLAAAAPESIASLPTGPRDRSGLRSDHFADYPPGIGYYGWLFEISFRTEDHVPRRTIHIGRFESLRDEMLRLLEETGVAITKPIAAYLRLAPPINASRRPRGITDVYSPALKQLVADRERSLIERFGYEFT